MDIGSAVGTARAEPLVSPVPRPHAGASAGGGGARPRPAWPYPGETGAPDYAAPLFGWAAWILALPLDGAGLGAIGDVEDWPAGREARAVCRAGRPGLVRRSRGGAGHAAPGKRCSCGIRASAHPALAAAELWATDTPGVLGRVALWGDLVECERGWRAGRAYPTNLWVVGTAEPPWPAHRLEWLASRLGRYRVPVDVIVCRTPEELVAEILVETPALDVADEGGSR